MNNLQNIQDKSITIAIEEELLSDEGVPASLIDVTTNEGIVVLKGTIGTLQARERAVQLVETIKGVRAIVDQITVNPVLRSDEDIQEDISKALFFDPATYAYPLTITVKNGIVTLSGTLDSWQKRQLSEWAAKGVKGVKAIQNEIKVEYKTTRLDVEIEAEIKRRLELDVWVDDALVNVQVENGQVTLSGIVGSVAEKEQAQYDAWVIGVSAVDHSKLVVELRDRREMRRDNKYVPRSNEEIKWAIEGSFLYDPRISTKPDIEVEKGKVILTGIVDNLMSKKAAEQDARNTIGVWLVKNYLKVRPVNPPGDMEIAQHVREALLWTSDVDRRQIVVACHNGTVRLYGTVSSNYEKTQAEDVAGRVQGVVEVENNLGVDQAWRWKSDEEIKQDIESRLQRSPFIEADQIKVTVQDGIAKLTGGVDVWQRHNIVVDHAFKGGAKSVLSRLQVSHDSDLSA